MTDFLLNCKKLADYVLWFQKLFFSSESFLKTDATKGSGDIRQKQSLHKQVDSFFARFCILLLLFNRLADYGTIWKESTKKMKTLFEGAKIGSGEESF